MIKGKNITLRPLRCDDWQKTIQWRNNVELTHLVMSHPFPITDTLEKEWYDSILKDKSNKTVYFGIEENQKNELIGIVFLNQINWINRVCRLGILIGDDKARGQGYGTEAMNLITGYAFNVLNLRKIVLEVVARNNAISLYKTLGFVKEGQLKKHHYYNNQFYDVHILSLFH